MAATSTVARRPLVLILAGQSDMVGRGEPDKLSDEVVRRCCGSGEGTQRSIRYTYVIDRGSAEGAESAAPGFGKGGPLPLLGRESQWSNAGERFSCGPEWGIVDELMRDSESDRRNSTYVIKFASGSTSLGKDWAPGGGLFQGLVGFVRDSVARIAAEQVGSVVGSSETLAEADRLLRADTAFLWLQGHSDASGNATMRAGYQKNFVEFVKRLRAELLSNKDQDGGENVAGALDFPVVASELDWLLNKSSKSSVRFAKRLQEINAALRDGCAELSQAEPPIPAAFASFPVEDDSWELTYHPDGHCATEGLLLLGQNLAKHLNSAFRDIKP
jgi:hypothetical protein